MIPVWQTRHGVEAIGNCLEACVASILDVPLQVVPDRAADVDADAWCEAVNRARREGADLGDLEVPELDAGHNRLLAWLRDRGVVWFELDLEHTERSFLDLADDLDTHWIANTHADSEPWLHATVWRGRRCVHNPDRAGTLDTAQLGTVESAVLLIASEPAKLARLQPLPDVAGEVDRLDRFHEGGADTTRGDGFRMQVIA